MPERDAPATTLRERRFNSVPRFGALRTPSGPEGPRF
jgi:hypothetical protein